MADTMSRVPMMGWIPDSGATAHICKICSTFTTFTPEQATVGGINKNGPQLAIEGRGDVDLLIAVTGRKD